MQSLEKFLNEYLRALEQVDEKHDLFFAAEMSDVMTTKLITRYRISPNEYQILDITQLADGFDAVVLKRKQHDGSEPDKYKYRLHSTNQGWRICNAWLFLGGEWKNWGR